MRKIALLILMVITYKCQQAPSPDAVMSGTNTNVYASPPNTNLGLNYCMLE
jgi:hypothetical protein